ncbi:MAG: hypothetical protein QHH10_11320 [Peptococcaceae bacterium]|nr:hypothetical protein [Peptococcaceae bacterium]MDH7525890.1 hypothetical protein [Peptococcaceae bacterium]
MPLKIPLAVWIFNTIPEGMSLAAVILSLASKRVKREHVLILGLVHAVFVYVFRLLPLPFFSHFFMLMVTMAVSTSWVAGIDIRVSHLCTVATFAGLYFCELGYFRILNGLGLITLEDIARSPVCWIIMGTPQVLTLFLAAWVIGRVKRGAVLEKLAAAIRQALQGRFPRLVFKEGEE